jgi:hypothetical protein
MFGSPVSSNGVGLVPVVCPKAKPAVMRADNKILVRMNPPLANRYPARRREYYTRSLRPDRTNVNGPVHDERMNYR